MIPNPNVINKTGINIKKIFDKKQKDYMDDLQNIDSGIYIINTVVNHDKVILQDLSRYFMTGFILDIYKLLMELLKIV